MKQKYWRLAVSLLSDILKNTIHTRMIRLLKRLYWSIQLKGIWKQEALLYFMRSNVLPHLTSGLSLIHEEKKAMKVDQVKLPTLILLMVTLFIVSVEFGAQFFVESAIVSEINGPARNHSSCKHEDPKNFASFVACSFYLAMPWQRGHGPISMFIQEIEPSKSFVFKVKI